MSGARLSSVRKGSAAGCATGRAPTSSEGDTSPLLPAMTGLGAHPAGFRGGIAAEADGLADFLELARVVVPVIVEHGAEVHVDRDLVRTHELLEEGNTRLAPLEGGLLKPFDVLQNAAALGIQRVRELGERHLSALFVEERGPGFDLYDRVLAFREGSERGRGVEARLEEEV